MLPGLQLHLVYVSLYSSLDLGLGQRTWASSYCVYMEVPSAKLMASAEAADLSFLVSLLLSLIPCCGLITKAFRLLSPTHCSTPIPSLPLPHT